MLAAALGTLDKTFLDLLARSQAIGSFAFRPDQMKTLDLLHRNFRMASRAGAHMHEHALRPHQLPTFQIFRLASGRRYKDEFLRFCMPIHDEYSWGYVEYYHLAENAVGLISIAGLFELTVMVIT